MMTRERARKQKGQTWVVTKGRDYATGPKVEPGFMLLSYSLSAAFLFLQTYMVSFGFVLKKAKSVSSVVLVLVDIKRIDISQEPN